MEGFYGEPYTHADRVWWIENLARLGMNVYVYAPKNDVYHRKRWRDPYPKSALTEFGKLISKGHSLGVRVGFAISPGNSIVYSDSQDRKHLFEKFRQFRNLGSKFFCLALDDVPASLQNTKDRRDYTSLGHAHVDLANDLQNSLGPQDVLWLIPTDYAGTEATEYLEELGKGLSPEIEIGWTGRTVLAPEILFDEAAARTKILGRKPLIWDNVPVSDGPMKPALHLGPYLGRDKRLCETTSGLILNPMAHPRASSITVSTAAAYMENPSSYNFEEAWTNAVRIAGQGAEDAFAIFSLAHRFGPMSPEEREPILECLWNRVEKQGEARATTASDFDKAIDTRLGVELAITANLSDRKLFTEIEPWLKAHHIETRRLEAASNLLISSLSQSEGIELLLNFLRFESALNEIPLPKEISYGPRKILYPQVTTFGDGTAAFGSDPALYRNKSLVDDIVSAMEERTIEHLTPSGGQQN